MDNLKDKSFRFALSVLSLSKNRMSNYRNLWEQLIDSSSSVGANIAESRGAQTKKDFIFKLFIAFKEIKESIYWLNLMKGAKIISENEHFLTINDAVEIEKILTITIKTAKLNLKRE